MPSDPRHDHNDDADPTASEEKSPSELDLDVLKAALVPPEQIERIAAAVGCVLVLTDRRFIVVRDGARFRPASGIRFWPIDRSLDVKVASTREATSRIEIEGTGSASTSVFVRKAQLKAVSVLIAALRARLYG